MTPARPRTPQNVETDRAHRERDALDTAVRSIAGVLDLDPVLQLIVDRVRNLAEAEYAALGIIGADGLLERFVTSGITQVRRRKIGALPRGRGLLGVIFQHSRSVRIPDIGSDRRRHGFPPHHPPMRSFLGVPVRVRGAAIGNFYLTNKRDADEFSADDQQLVERFALHAAIAIDNARLHEQVRRLAVVAERDRIGRDLHDGVIQRLYAVTLTLDDLPDMMDEEPGEARHRVDQAIEALQVAIGDIREFVYGLRPALPEPEDLRRALGEVADEVRRTGRTTVTVEVDEKIWLDSDEAADLVAIAREALSNVQRHAAARRAEIHLTVRGEMLRLVIADDGHGFDARGRRTRHQHGLANIRDRATAMGGRVTVRSRLGTGTRIIVHLPLDAGGLPKDR
ncbi:MAG: GAF domain-containing sensor histidine kinase [Candidatus Limnocylindria bacterium]